MKIIQKKNKTLPMQQPNFSQKPTTPDPSNPACVYGQSISKEEYYGGARVYQASPFAPAPILQVLPLTNTNATPSYVDSQKIKKKERNNSNSSERNAKSKNSSIQGSSNNQSSFPLNIKKPPIIREGDWECPECKNINFAKRTECNRCKASKPVPNRKDRKTASHLGGPPGLFKEGDWLCPKCRNVNFQRRNKCNRCGENKPDDNEVRTGKAGGHYDRQDPKDKKSYKESDDEYDDFGRRKRKNRKDDGSKSRSKSNGRNKDNSRDNRRRKRTKSRSRSRDRSRSRERSKDRSRDRSRDRQRSRS